MSVSTFEDSLAGLAESCRRVPPGGVADAVADLVEPPAVGVALPYEGAALPDAVATDFDAGDLGTAETGVTPAGLGVADYGTVTLRSTDAGDELVALYPPRHVVVVHEDDVVPDMPSAFDRLGAEFADGQATQVLATGPSATADMGDLVRGVHGPREVHVVVVEA